MKRHRWPPAGAELREDHHHTIRVCLDCGVQKVTRHEGREHWIEWRDADGVKLEVQARPECVPVVETEGGDA